MAEHVPEITRIIGVRRDPSLKIDLKFPSRCRLDVFDDEIPRSALNLSQGLEKKFVYIESSYGLARHTRVVESVETIYVPMWEQGSVPLEAQFADSIVCVTKHTYQTMSPKENQFQTLQYLPWPVETNGSTKRVVTSVKTILHNAGSLGGNLRKGTYQAIEMFQKSGLGKKGVTLIIHAWKPPTPELAALLMKSPDGIIWSNQFLERADDIYATYEPDLLLCPSKIEGHALVVLEAMARGIPALVTDSPPINEYEHQMNGDFMLLKVARYEPSPLAAPYAIVDTDWGAEKLSFVCGWNMERKSRQVADLVEREYSWNALGEKWRALCL
ncbi:MAG: glycosyltransferase [Gemmatimonadota bacterium]